MTGSWGKPWRNCGSIASSSNGFFLSTKFPNRLWAQSAFCPEGTEGFSPAERRKGSEVIHSLSPRTEVKNKWSCTSSSLYVSWCTQKCPYLCSNFITARSKTNNKRQQNKMKDSAEKYNFFYHDLLFK
jgi:hypothetical protein